jgi:hypothetical protein
MESETEAKILRLLDVISVEVSDLRNDFSGLRAEFSDLRNDVSLLRGGVNGLRSEMRSGFDRLERRIEPLER